MKCEIIKDLLPSYIDKLTSEESNREIEKHLWECEECRAYFETMEDEEALKEGALEDKERFKEDIKPFKKLKWMTFGVIIAVCVIGMAYESLVSYYASGTTASSKDVYVEYEKVGNLVTVSMRPCKENMDIRLLGNGSESVENTIEPVKYHRNPFRSYYGDDGSFQFYFKDESTILKSDGSGEVKLDGSEMLAIEFTDGKYELCIKDLYTEEGIKELEKKLGK